MSMMMILMMMVFYGWDASYTRTLQAFYTTDRVMTVSFHKYGEYFPGTGDIKVWSTMMIKSSD